MRLPGLQRKRSQWCRHLLLASIAIVLPVLTPAYGQATDDSRENRMTDQEDPSAVEFLRNLQLRSVVALPGGHIFSLHDSMTQRSFWMTPGEIRHGFEVLDFDPERDVLRVRYGGVERNIHLSRSRILEVDSPAEEHERVLERWQERRTERRGFRQRWEQAVSESDELREIEDHLREIIEEMRGLREALAEAREDSDAYRQVLERQRLLAREHRMLEDYLSASIAADSGFEPEDAETVELLKKLVRHAWPELEVNE